MDLSAALKSCRKKKELEKLGALFASLAKEQEALYPLNYSINFTY